MLTKDQIININETISLAKMDCTIGKTSNLEETMRLFGEAETDMEEQFDVKLIAELRDHINLAFAEVLSSNPVIAVKELSDIQKMLNKMLESFKEDKSQQSNDEED